MLSVIEPRATLTMGPASGGKECGHPRDFMGNKYVYVMVSPRARGLSVGINLNPDKRCNFDCAYCEIDRHNAAGSAIVDLDLLASELEATIHLINSGGLAQQDRYARLAPDLCKLKHVALSGDGEPTLSPQFYEVVETVVHLRARGQIPFFKIVLITNASQFEEDRVQAGLKLLGKQDEIWAKLDGGTEAYLKAVNKSDISIERILEGILRIARQRPVIIQSLFPELKGDGPSVDEVAAYAARLNALKQAGAQISMVQIYSATRPPSNPACSHLPLKTLSTIAQNVRQATGLNVQVF